MKTKLIFLLCFCGLFSSTLATTVDITSDGSISSETYNGITNYYYLSDFNTTHYSANLNIIIHNLPEQFHNSDVVTIQLERINEYGRAIYFRTTKIVETNITLPAISTDLLPSSVFILTVYKDASISYTIPIYIVKEKCKTYTIQTTRFSFRYVDDFFKLSSIDSTRFFTYIRKSLDFSWKYQLNRLKVGGLSAPYCAGFYNIIIGCSGDVPVFLYRNPTNFQGPFSDPSDNIRLIYIPVNLQRELKSTGKLDDSTFFKMVIGHEFFHGLQFSEMKCSALLAANPTKERADAELEKRKWLIEGQARFIETVMMDSSIRNGKNAAYVMNSMEQDYSSDCKQFLTRTINNVITQITKQQYV